MARAPRATLEAKAAAEAAAADEAPRWRVMEKSFIGHSLLDEGAEITFIPKDPENGKVTIISENLSPLNASAQAIIDAQAEDHPDKGGTVPPAVEPAEAEQFA